jgi:hypothetical protein
MSAWNISALTSWVPGQTAQSARDKTESGNPQFEGIPKFSIESFVTLPDFLGGEGKHKQRPAMIEQRTPNNRTRKMKN